jgi:hypothetical protein
MSRGKDAAVILAVLASTLLAACDVEVTGNRRRDGDVDIRTPIGALSVRSDMGVNNTGLPIFPGATPLRDRHNGDRASVKINTSFFGFEVQAARFETSAAPADVVEFYRAEMRAFGDVVECTGDVDFKGRRGRKEPVCDEEPRGREIQLISGNEDTFRTVAIKPRGTGSEFALVYIDSRTGS